MRLLPLLLLLIADAASAEERFLHSIPLRLAPGLDLQRAEALSIRAESETATARRLAPYSEVDEQAPGAYTGASFVIDFDEPPVEALHAKLVETHGDTPSAAQLVRFTHDFVANKSYERGFELASQVARHGSGDCTEHAVLLTALARATGKPARVVFGVVLLREGSGAAAYGHAWSEIYEDGAWQLGEATALSDDSVLGYVAVEPMRDEGPGFSLPLVATFEASWFKGVSVSAAEPMP